ncbi:hypothetical protein SVIOM342S_00409 [Streptomyces violaceorubidus]
MPTGFAARWSAFVERRPKLLGALGLVVITVLGPAHSRPARWALPTRATTPRAPPPARRTTSSPTACAPRQRFAHPGHRGPRRRGPPRPGQPRRHPAPTEGVSSVTPVMYRLPAAIRVPHRRTRVGAGSRAADQRPGRAARSEVLPRAEAGRARRARRGVTAGYARRRHRRQAAPLRRRRHRPRLPAAPAGPLVGIPVKAAAMNVAAWWPLRRGRGECPVGLGERTARPRQRRADRTLPARDMVSVLFGSAVGAPGLPGQPDVRGVAEKPARPCRVGLAEPAA